MTLIEAKQKMAELMKAGHDWFEANKLPTKVNSKTNIEEIDATEKERKKFRYERKVREAKIRNLCAQLAANPDFSDIMIGWCVEVCGKDPCSLERLERIVTIKDDFEEAFKQSGGLQNAVMSLVEKTGFLIEGCGGGEIGWHIGVMCTDKQAKRLCQLLYQKFQKAINANLLEVYKRFWDYRLPDMMTWQDAENYLSL